MRLWRRLGDEFLNCGLCKQPHPLAPSPDMRGGNICQPCPKHMLPVSPIYIMIREGNIGGGLEIKKRLEEGVRASSGNTLG